MKFLELKTLIVDNRQKLATLENELIDTCSLATGEKKKATDLKH